MNMTVEKILKEEHNLISEASMWEHDSAEEALRLGFYNEGIHDMAQRLIELVQKG